MRIVQRGMPGLPLVVACAFILAGAVGPAAAQAYPSRPITMVVPFAAGGPTDTLARIMAERMKGSLGQPVIVENVTGGAGTVAVGRVARSAPDGYTLSIGNVGTHVITGATHALQYDLLKDLEPVALLANNPVMIVSKNAVPAQNLTQLIAWLKANEDKVSAGTSGAGAPSHVSGILFQNLTGTRFQFVPYRGAGPVLQDLMAGQIDLMFDQVSNSLPHVRGGKIKAYAVAAKARTASAPDVPTVDEAGLPDFHVSVWHALWVPRGTPKTVIAAVNAAVKDALADPAVRARLADLGQDVPALEQQMPEALRAFHKAEVERWWPIIRAANITSQ
jgi:tripartite-type tricarboxylate transporter receptor subunit TctC